MANVGKWAELGLVTQVTQLPFRHARGKSRWNLGKHYWKMLLFSVEI